MLYILPQKLPCHLSDNLQKQDKREGAEAALYLLEGFFLAKSPPISSHLPTTQIYSIQMASEADKGEIRELALNLQEVSFPKIPVTPSLPPKSKMASEAGKGRGSIGEEE